MPLYCFACHGCEQESSTHRSMTGNTTDKTCPNCGEPMHRRFTPPGFATFREHFNPAVGKVVSSDREFRDDLKRASEEASIKTGIPHNYVPVELGKPKEGPGTEEQAKKHRDLGTPGFERRKSYF